LALRLKRFLEELLRVLREDYPEKLEELVKEGRGITCFEVLDAEKAVIKFRQKSIRIAASARKSEIDLRIYLSRDCLFRILEGRQTIEEAINGGELKVYGDPAAILSFYRVWERVLSIARTSPRFYFLTYRLR
jgi:hypothetical protein